MALIVIRGRRDPIELERVRALKIKQQKYGDERLNIPKADPDTEVDLGNVTFILGDIRSIDLDASSDKRSSERPREQELSDSERLRVKEQIESFLKREDLHPDPIDRKTQFYGFVGAASVFPKIWADGSAHLEMAIRPALFTFWERILGQYQSEPGSLKIWTKQDSERWRAANPKAASLANRVN